VQAPRLPSPALAKPRPSLFAPHPVPSDTAIVFTPLLTSLLGLECAFLFGGILLLILRRHLLVPRFLGLAPAPLTRSEFRPSELFLAIAFAFGGAVILQYATAVACGYFFPTPEPGRPGPFYIFTGAALQFGILAGLGHAWFWHLRPARRPPPLTPTPPHVALPLSRILRGAFFTFLVAMIVVGPASLLWQSFLKWCGIKAPPQNLVHLFSETGDLPSLVMLITLAIVVAPLTEELAFRIGLFRWLRGRAPRGVALLLPAFVFAALHGYLSVFGPLVLLAVILALAYEHYGHPAVPILAHALFNLNSVALLLAGFPT
jgi:uncharacterized protein